MHAAAAWKDTTPKDQGPPAKVDLAKGSCERKPVSSPARSFIPSPTLTGMHKPKPYVCSICGAEVPDLPMVVLKHQMSHVSRRPFARDRREPEPEKPQPEDRKPA